VQVLVVGAGVVGCAVAYELVARGAEVQMLDARRAGEGASQAAAGILAPYIEGHSPEFLQLGVQSLGLYDAFIERVSRDSGLPIDYRRIGTLEVALNEEQAHHLRTTAEKYNATHVEHQYLEPAAARVLEPGLAPTATGALLIPNHGYVQSRALVHALEVAARQKGVSVKSTVKVEALQQRHNRVQVHLSEGSTIEVDALVLATGSWSARVAVKQAMPAPVKPIRGQLLNLVCNTPSAAHVIWSPDCYLVPLQDGTILVGATVEDVGFDERSTAAAVQHLLQVAQAVLPTIKDARLRDVRVGLRPVSPDELPLVGPSCEWPNVIYATGHYRNGVLLAPLTAKIVADFLLENAKAPELMLTTPSRFGL
tara:strand:- start:6950 stop:8050 length:1101 start_codon:yes stop_codon:yes gene_type:complete